MHWLNWNTWFGSESKLALLADRLAAACQEQVWRVVQQHALVLSPAEARGYVRARAGLIVARTVDAELQRSSQWAARREQLRDLTTETVVRVIGAQLRAVRPANKSLRRAG
jgi:hypothetical protein